MGEINADVSTDLPPLGIYDSRLVRLAGSSLLAVAQHTELLKRYRPEEIGVFVGTTTGGLEKLSARLAAAFTASKPWTWGEVLCPGSNNGALKQGLRRCLPIRGPIFVYAQACASGALAIAEARRALQTGLVRAAVAGGFDVLQPLTLAGFAALQVIDSDFCQPLSGNSRGINLAEGGGWLVLEKDTSLAPQGFLLGAGASTDAHHMTQPEPNGLGMEAAMRAALKDAACQPEEIVYINAHGTGTASNDRAELAALSRIFPMTCPRESTKALHGHTLAGAGALEAVVTIEQGRRLHYVGPMLSNSFGFGGSNISLILAAAR